MSKETTTLAPFVLHDLSGDGKKAFMSVDLCGINPVWSTFTSKAVMWDKRLASTLVKNVKSMFNSTIGLYEEHSVGFFTSFGINTTYASNMEAGRVEQSRQCLYKECNLWVKSSVLLLYHSAGAKKNGAPGGSTNYS